jgi:hypothetical protein
MHIATQRCKLLDTCNKELRGKDFASERENNWMCNPATKLGQYQENVWRLTATLQSSAELGAYPDWYSQ